MESSSLVTAIGFAAAAFTTFSFLPQVLKVWRSRRADGISLGMYVVFCTGIVLWLVYGVLIGDWPLIVANIITLTLAGSVLVLALRYRSRS